VFHRVISTFMVQGGGYDAQYERKATRPPVQNEADNGLKNLRATVAMARTPDPHSGTAQFFVNVTDNAFLDHRSPDAKGWGYCVFGRVIAGKEVVDHIAGVPTGSRGGHQDVPTQDVIIERAEVTD